MLIFVLLTEKRFVVLFWNFFKYLGNHNEIEKPKSPKIFVDARVSFYSKTG